MSMEAKTNEQVLEERKAVFLKMRNAAKQAYEGGDYGVFLRELAKLKARAEDLAGQFTEGDA